MNDTSPEVEARYRAMLMSRTAEERVMMGARMFDAARMLVLASMPPGLPDQERRQRLFARLYPELTGEAVPPDLRSHPA